MGSLWHPPSRRARAPRRPHPQHRHRATSPLADSPHSTGYRNAQSPECRRGDRHVRARQVRHLSIGYARPAMADDVLPKPEPKEIDEKKALELKHMCEDNVLKGVPYGDEKCGNCL